MSICPYSLSVTEPKYEASPRTVRRWVLGLAGACLVIAASAATWVVEPGQRWTLVAWAVAAAIMASTVHWVIPDSADRKPKQPPVRDSAGVRQAIRQSTFALVPVFFGSFMRDLIPGDPGWVVKFGVHGCAALVAMAVEFQVMRGVSRRRRLNAR